MAIGGLMHDIKHRDRPFHIETEYYAGTAERRIVTVIYERGTVRKKISSAAESGDEETCRAQMTRQHKEALQAIVRGEFDATA